MLSPILFLTTMFDFPAYERKINFLVVLFIFYLIFDQLSEVWNGRSKITVSCVAFWFCSVAEVINIKNGENVVEKGFSLVLLYNLALVALHSTTPAASIWFISTDVKPYSSRTSTVCSPITGSEARQGSAGVRDRNGAGLGLSSPLESLMKEALSWLCGCELTWSKDSTGVTQASVPSKIVDQSSWVFEAKHSVKIRLSSGQWLKLIWSGSSPASNSKPIEKKDLCNNGDVFVNRKIM